MGTLELHGRDGPVALPASSQRLLAFAALRRKPLARGYVAGHLWLDSTEQRAAANLRSALWRLHRAAGDVVWASGRELGLARWVEVDVHHATAAAHQVLAGRGRVPADLAVTLIASDDVLPDWYDDWLDTERERFRQIRLHALERLCERLTVERRFGEALQAGLAALRTEPLRESAHRAMIGMHLAEGNLGEAVRQYEACERLLSSQLGVKPARQTSELIDNGMSARNGRRRRARSTWRSARQPPARRRTGRAARPRRDPDRRAS
jgi:DNA-binding SARP family transcriptional activator